MQTSILLRKGLAIVIIFVLGSSIIPVGCSLSTNGRTSINDSNAMMTSELIAANPDGINVTISGTMGQNGWYVSGVVIKITGAGVNHTYYSFDNQTWTEYMAPITVSTDGVYELYVSGIDPYGEHQYYGPFPFKIDTTPPYVKITFPEPGFIYIINGNSDVLIKMPFFMTIVIGKINVMVDASDNQSGVNRVEFWVDNDLRYTDTIAPYNWTWSEIGFFQRTLKAVAYDNAGNYNSTDIVLWKIQFR